MIPHSNETGRSAISIMSQCLWWRHRLWNLWISQEHKNLDISRTKHFSLNKKFINYTSRATFMAKNSFVAEVTFKKLSYTQNCVQKQFLSFHIKIYVSCVDLLLEHRIELLLICKINSRDNFIWKCPWHHQMPIFRHYYFAHFEKTVNDSKSYMSTVPVIKSFKFLNYFCSGKISFLLFASLW